MNEVPPRHCKEAGSHSVHPYTAPRSSLPRNPGGHSSCNLYGLKPSKPSCAGRHTNITSFYGSSCANKGKGRRGGAEGSPEGCGG
eukprot:563182-Prorocentrum_minimum.AAC.1